MKWTSNEVDALDPNDGVESMSSSSLTNSSSPPADRFDNYNESTVLLDTVRFYGSLLLIMVVVFSWMRRRFPKIYNIRKCVDDLKTHLADDQHGFFSWMWHVYGVTDDEMMEECGMDALCFVRLIDMGFRLSLVGIFNALWLIPIYATAGDMEFDTTDDIVRTTVGHVPSGSIRLYATVFAAYILFGYTMYIILKEFEWYIEVRHRFLSKPLTRHFAVFVRNIPPEYRSNQSLEAFFRHCFQENDILEARLAINAPKLSATVAQRDQTLANLEHAVALYNRDGIRPRHRRDTLLVLGNDVDSIDYYASLLEKQNEEVSRRIDQLQAVVAGAVSLAESAAQNTQSSARRPERISVPNNNQRQDQVPLLSAQSSEEMDPLREQGLEQSQDPGQVQFSGVSFSEDQVPRRRIGKNTLDTLTKTFHTTVKKASSFAGGAADKATSIASKATSVAAGAASRAVNIVTGGDEGEVFPAGFVVFTKRSTANAALQMVHHHTPFAMEVLEAPDPKEVFWGNVSRTHKDLEVGTLLSFGMSACVCLLWTIPMSFFASLSNASHVRSDVKWVEELFIKYPLLVPITEQIAPFLVVLSNASLPMILGAISLFEGPISNGVVEASKFAKLAAFMIIQTFFVSAISGGVASVISAILDNWQGIVTLLSESLPAQGTYFMQIILIMTTLTAGFEMFRLYPLTTAILRSSIGPNLTEKEQNKIFMGLRPLSKPPPFPHADFTSRLVLYFMILFVYAVISPMTPIVTGVCFVFMGSMFRGQFIYIYAPSRDSGGKLWAHFVQIMLSCMLIAQITIVGLLSLKKATKQIPLFIPLPIITVLFNFYIRKMHFRVASYLPTQECLLEDFDHGGSIDLSFLRGAYVQPQLAADRNVRPDQSLLGLVPSSDGYGAC